MTLSAGMRLGHYEVISSLGAGGMGEVFRARDTRLGRDVAIKVLPARLRENPEALARFEREAKAVAALSHPNILAIHEFGVEDATAYAVTELLEGETLRDRLAAGALPLRKAVECAAQIARGLAAAHAKGIVHRDLKPENVFVTTDGRVKVLDFGLARQSAIAGKPDTSSPTMSRHTDAGTILGTAGYMSPEQVRGQAVDHRSDLFSLGCVLYEMLTGRRAFQRETAAETMTAILKEDPPEIADSGVVAPPAMDRLVRHCLEKRPEERFQSAQDVAFDLETALEPSGRVAAPGVTGPHAGVSGWRRVAPAAIAAALAVGVVAGIWYGRHHAAAGKPEAEPSFTRLTIGQGTMWGARFTPDGRTVIYSAAWEGQPLRLYHTSTDGVEATPLTLPDAHLLSVSPAGELAVSLGHRFEGWIGAGTLARSPLLGGGARPVLEDVREADWAPDGSQLAIVRRAAGRERLEYPAGNVLYETSGFVSHIRFSPKGDRIAFADHHLFSDDIGAVSVVDLAGRKTDLTSSWSGGLRGLGWSPTGDEVWFTAARGSEDKSLRAVDLSGRERIVLGGLTDMIVFDVSRDGRVLLGREASIRHVEALVPGSARPRDFSLARQNSFSRNISADPKALAITDQGKSYEVFLRSFDGSLPVHLGEGDTYGLSPDGRWALALTTESRPRILLHPTGPGQKREIPNAESVDYLGMKWLPSGRIVAFGAVGKGRIRGYVIDPADGSQRPFTPEGVEPVRYWSIPVSPDAARVVARDADGRLSAYPVDGGPPDPIDGLSALDVLLEWSADGGALFVARPGETSWRIRRHELAGGRETPWTEIVPARPGGIRLSQVFITPDGRYWVHGYSRLLTDLYLAEGLR